MLNQSITISLSVVAIAMLTPAFANTLPVDTTARLKVGFNVGLVNDGYHSDNKVSVLPQAFYDNHRWYLEGSEGGFYPYKDTKNHIRIGLTYDGRTFDPDDANVSTLKPLEERKFSILAHASYMYITPIGGIRLKVANDALSRHDGLTATLTHLSRFKFANDALTVYPSIGLAWYNKDYNAYYYGISPNEQTKTGITSYNPKSSINPYVAVMAEYTLNDQWSIFGHGRIEKLSNTQKSSPIVDSALTATARIGVNYSF